MYYNLVLIIILSVRTIGHGDLSSKAESFRVPLSLQICTAIYTAIIIYMCSADQGCTAYLLRYKSVITCLLRDLCWTGGF